MNCGGCSKTLKVVENKMKSEKCLVRLFVFMCSFKTPALLLTNYVNKFESNHLPKQRFDLSLSVTKLQFFRI